MVQLKDIDYELADILLDNVINKKGTLTYGEVAAELSKRLGYEVNPHLGLAYHLDNVSTLCFKLGLPLLSARVVRKDITDVKAIGDGFIRMAISFRPEYKDMNPVSAWKNELKLTRECTNWHRLREHLTGMPIDVIMNRESASAAPEGVTEDEPQSEVTPPVPEPDFSLSEPIFPDEIDSSVIKEGAVKTVNVSVRERNPAARQKCIEYYGTNCTICGIDLGEIYGEELAGRIHVHHLNPISEYDEEHEVNPIEDLRPVCPNCHMVIHCRQDKPYSIEEVKAMMEQRKT